MLNNLRLNKGTVFSRAERQALGLEAMLPWEVLPQMQTAATAWNLANHFIISEDMAANFKAAIEAGNPRQVAVALGDIARAKGMTQIAREAGLGR